MTYEKVSVNRIDRSRLNEAIQTARRSWGTYGPYLDWLGHRINHAAALDPSEMPQDVVTMNSKVRLKDMRTGNTRTATLVYPHDRRRDDDLSVFDPPGLAILGRRVGDVVGWIDDEQSNLAQVDELDYQPEAAGDLDR